jgi:hypothetical protein
MNPLIHALPLDLTGMAVNNRTKREYHDLSDQMNLPFRVIAMDKGYFYTDDLKVVDGRGYELQRDVDYQCTGLNPDAVKDTAKTVCGVVVILNRQVHPEIYIDAQMVGGLYCNMAYTIVELARGLLNNTRKVHWNNIEHKPDAFNPNGHQHALWDLHEFTDRTVQLKRMTTAIETMGDRLFEANLDDYKRLLKIISDDLALTEQQLQVHIANQDNPHRLTAVQVQLGNVQNFPKATDDDARQANASILNRYATPWSLKLSVDANFTPLMTSHVNNLNNPHELTAAQLLAYTIPEFNNIAALYADRGATLNQSTLWEGATYLAKYNQARAGNNAANITSGRLAQVRYAVSGANADYVLNGAGNWSHIATTFATLAPKPVRMYYMGGIFGPDAASHAQVLQIISNAYGNATAYPRGTMILFYEQSSWDIGTSNGSQTSTLRTLVTVARSGTSGTAADWTYTSSVLQ